MNRCLLLVMLLFAATVQAQDPFAPRRCIHSIDESLIQPVRTPDGMRRAMQTSTSDGLGKYGQSAKGAVKSIGSPKIPVIMVAFQDVTFHETTTREKISRLFNEHGYSDEQHCMGSIRDYFIDNSGGLFAPEFVVVDSVTANNKVEYYGANSVSSKNKNIRELLKDAITLAQADGVDFAQFIDGTTVPMVIIFFAGVGENSCFDSDKDRYIWPHFSNYTTTVGGVTFSSYFAGNEWRKSYALGANGSIVVTDEKIDGIGVLIHEFGHALGLPDMYPTNGQYYETPDWWSVMDYGEYYANSYRPVGLTAYEKSYLGWLDVKELTAAKAVQLQPGEAVLIRNTANNNEYYLLENRQPDKWYPDNYGNGMLVMHVDYLQSEWTSNRLNNVEDHLRVHVLPADGAWTGVALSNFSWADLRTDLYGYAADGPTNIEGAAWRNYTGGLSVRPLYDICQTTDGGARSIAFSYDFLRGDVNCDGAVSADDVSDLVGYLIGEAAASFVPIAADLNGDGRIDVLDVTELIDMMMSKK